MDGLDTPLSTDTPATLRERRIVQEAMQRFKISEEYFRPVRKAALDDLRFRAGEQWPEDIKSARELDKRPCLTINRLPQYVKQITNAHRQSRMALSIIPVDDDGDVETAQVFQGLIRHIERDSRADQAYDTAFEYAVSMSFGYIRVVTEYVDVKGFEQKVSVKKVNNPFSVYLDPRSSESDGSDLEWAFVISEMSKEEFKRTYPTSSMSEVSDWSSAGNSAPGWIDAEGCRIAEYFYTEYKTETLCLLSTGEVVSEEYCTEKNVEYVSKRVAQVPVIKWCKTNGFNILEETTWLGQHIPIIPVYGDSYIVDGKLYIESAIRHAKDSQRMYNYWATAETEIIALAPKAPWIGVQGQFEGLEDLWRQANMRNFAYLEYKTVSSNGQVVGPPQRNIQEPPISAITSARLHAADDIKATTGIYDAGMGNVSNERSGKAILARASQGQVSNYHFVDNFARALRQVGRVLIDIIPKVYNRGAVVRILGDDNKSRIVKLANGNAPEEVASSTEKIYDLTVGRYDVSADIGSSYASRREEAVQSMLQLTQNQPKLIDVIGDLLVKSMDWPGATEIAERLRKLLPPGLLEEEGQAGDPKQLEQVAQQSAQKIAEQAELIQKLVAELTAVNDAVDSKEAELASRERIEAEKIRLALVTLLVTNESADDKLLLTQELLVAKSREEARAVSMVNTANKETI